MDNFLSKCKVIMLWFVRNHNFHVVKRLLLLTILTSISSCVSSTVVIQPIVSPLAAPNVSDQSPTSLMFVTGNWQGGSDILWSYNEFGTHQILEMPPTRYYHNELKLSPDASHFVINNNNTWIDTPIYSGNTGIDTQYQPVSVDGSLVSSVWSFDSKLLALLYLMEDQSLPHYNLKIALLDSDSQAISHLPLVIEEVPLTYDLKWSPDGRYLSVARSHRKVWLIELATDTVHEIDLPFYCAGDGLWKQRWSPHNDWIALHYLSNGAPGSSNLCLYRNFTSSLDVPIFNTIGSFDWSPDGKYLYFSKYKFNSSYRDSEAELPYLESQLFRFNTVSAEATVVMPLQYSISELTISPDGKYAVGIVGSGESGTMLSILNLQRFEETTELILPGIKEAAFRKNFEWSVDSRSIIFFAGQSHTPDGIDIRNFGAFYQMSIQTREITQLTDNYWVKDWDSPSFK